MKSWISSPVSINYLLSLYKNAPSYQKKYIQIYRELKNKQNYVTCNQLFLSPSNNSEEQYVTSDISVEKIQFQKNKDTSQHIMKWLNQHGSFSEVDIGKYVLPNTMSLLCNISVFKDTWKCSLSNPIMKVHNSFTYTEDIKYEARLLELPMQDDDFRLVIIVPNEVSSIHGLFSKLVDEGMDAAVGCVRPLFTFSTVLEAPSIEFSSENNIRFSESKCATSVLSGAQLGNVQINENGTNVSLLTLLSSTHKSSIDKVNGERSKTVAPFHFAVLYKDTAVFTGRYMKRVK